MITVGLDYKQHTLIFLSLVIFCVVSWGINSGYATTLTASHYELSFVLEHPQQLVSKGIVVERAPSEQNRDNLKNVYLQSFRLEGTEGREIGAQHITIKTPYYEGTLDSANRFLLLKPEQQWAEFKLGLLPGAAYNPPGFYTGKVVIEGLDWEFLIEVEVMPFVSLQLLDKTLQFNIEQPATSEFFIGSELCTIVVDTNHTQWDILARLQDGKLTNSDKHVMPQNKLFIRTEKSGEKLKTRGDIRNDFIQLSEEGDTPILNGTEYMQGKTEIRFGIKTGMDWTATPAGSYSNEVIFTIRQTVD